MLISLRTFRSPLSNTPSSHRLAAPPDVPGHRRITLLSTDFHIGPIADLKSIIRRHPELGVDIVDLSLSGACGSVGTCATAESLKVLRAGVVNESLYVTSDTKLAFFDAYRKPAEKRPGAKLVVNGAVIDAVICSHPVGSCELYMPFGVPLILWATTRFEQGREHDKDKLANLVRNVRAIAGRDGNSVLANNLYDAAYMNYFTGLSPVYAPSVCAYPRARFSWRPYLRNLILAPGAQSENRPVRMLIPVFGYRPGLSQGTTDEYLEPLNDLVRARRLPFRFRGAHEAFADKPYEYSELASHAAVLHLPYQVSVMSFFEHYRMGIPIFAPSLELLTRWQMSYLYLSEKGWAFLRPSLVPPHEHSNHTLDPNDDLSYGAISHWLGLADFYHFPHLILFDSWADLVEKLAAAQFHEISEKMIEFAKALESQTVIKWATVFDKVRASWEADKGLAPLKQSRALSVREDYTSRMDAFYGADKWVLY